MSPTFVLYFKLVTTHNRQRHNRVWIWDCQIIYLFFIHISDNDISFTFDSFLLRRVCIFCHGVSVLVRLLDHRQRIHILVLLLQLYESVFANICRLVLLGTKFFDCKLWVICASIECVFVHPEVERPRDLFDGLWCPVSMSHCLRGGDCKIVYRHVRLMLQVATLIIYLRMSVRLRRTSMARRKTRAEHKTLASCH